MKRMLNVYLLVFLLFQGCIGNINGIEHQAQKADSFREPDSIWVPTPPEVMNRMLEIAKIQKGDILYDLGCGDGRIVVAAAEKYGIRAVGYEMDSFMVSEAERKVNEHGMGKLVSIVRADIFTLDLSDATVITLYLVPGMIEKLIPQFEKLRPGTRIVAYFFDIPGIPPDTKVKITDNYLYLWTAPLKRTR